MEHVKAFDLVTGENRPPTVNLQARHFVSRHSDLGSWNADVGCKPPTRAPKSPLPGPRTTRVIRARQITYDVALAVALEAWTEEGEAWSAVDGSRGTGQGERVKGRESGNERRERACRSR